MRWESDGEGQYQIQAGEKTDRGTEVILHLREEDKEFLEPGAPAPVGAQVFGSLEHSHRPEDRAIPRRPSTRPRRSGRARNPNSRTRTTRRSTSTSRHDSEDARAWAHNKVEGNIEYTSLLYLPKRAPFDLFERDQKGGVQLYVKRVFIMDRAAELLPPYLRFMRGLVDTADLPLNVSRELLQNNRTVEKIKIGAGQALAGFARGSGGEQAGGICGILEDLRRGAEGRHHRGSGPKGAHREAAAIPFHRAAGDAPEVTLEQYVSRMKADQKAIYYLTADTLAAARNSPHLEGFRAKGMEVLLLTDRIDEWVAGHLHEFEGKTLANVASSAADVASAIETPEKAAAESAFKDTAERLGKVLSGKIASAQVSARLTDSPAVLVAGEFGVSLRMGRILKQAGQSNPFATLPILELNPKHPLVERLKDTADETAFADLAHVLYDQAMLAEGGELDDPAIFVRRVNRLIVEGLAAQQSKIILS